MFSFTVESQSDLDSFAARVACLCRTRDVIALFGDLGMGKTVFSRAFIRSFGRPEEEVPSPTFTLVQTYDVQSNSGEELTVWHFDLYRLKQSDEVYELGFEEALSEGISLIEWPERAGRLLPKNRLDIHISPGQTLHERILVLTPHGTEWESRIKLL